MIDFITRNKPSKTGDRRKWVTLRHYYSFTLIRQIQVMKSSERHFFHYTERTYHYIIMHFFKKQKQSIIKLNKQSINLTWYIGFLVTRDSLTFETWRGSWFVWIDDPEEFGLYPFELLLCCSNGSCLGVLIGQPSNSTTFNSKPVVEPIISGAPPTVYTPKNPKNEKI
jgi:hypothetical protein